MNSVSANSTAKMPLSKRWGVFLKQYSHSVLGKEISSITKYFERVLHYSPINSMGIAEFVEGPRREIIQSHELSKIKDTQEASAVLLDGNLNHTADIQLLLQDLSSCLNRSSRVVALLYNPYYKSVFFLMNKLGLRSGELPSTFVSRGALSVLARLADFEIVRIQPALYFPFRWFGFGTMLNSILRAIPFLKWFSFAAIVTLRPLKKNTKAPSLSILIPARNEAGNIPQILARLKNLEHIPIEIIFVEGHSKDNTWDTIQELQKKYFGPFKIKAIKQMGKGKKNAVTEGFEHATHDLLTILDADMTMPPEKVISFYQAYCKGQADFVNGSRMVYSMENGAMQFLNHLGNIFFAKAISFVTDTQLTDTLCGTKLLSRKYYDATRKWCADFGDFDPFGDFELIFPAAVLGFGTIDIPIRYEARTYGETNISRFRHGFQLLRMTLIGFFTIKMGRNFRGLCDDGV